MARQLAPCGTFSAYKRHKRNGEPVDAACQTAAREYRREQRAGERAAGAEVVQLAVERDRRSEMPAELADAVENFRIVKAAMESATPGAVAPLSKRRQELVAEIARLQGDSGQRGGVLSDLAKRRAARIANAQD